MASPAAQPSQHANVAVGVYRNGVWNLKALAGSVPLVVSVWNVSAGMTASERGIALKHRGSVGRATRTSTAGDVVSGHIELTCHVGRTTRTSSGADFKNRV